MNIVNEFKKAAKLNPEKCAIRLPKKNIWGKYSYQSLTFKQLDQKIDAYASAFHHLGIQEGVKTLLFVKPSLEFSALVFAIFKVGAIPVLIDPGMGKENLFNAIKLVKPSALIAQPIVHFLKFFFKTKFQSIQINIMASKWKNFFFKSTYSTQTLLSQKVKNQNTVELDPNEICAILFTSGGTGIPKGVVYTPKVFSTQTKILQELFQLSSDDIDLPGFPLFSLFTLTMGMTSCIPDMNPAKPAQANAKNLVRNIQDNQATFVAGSPAIWQRVANYCQQNNVTLPSVKYLVMFGAPVSIKLHQQFSKILTNGDTFTPYGATESLPVANTSGKFILKNTITQTMEGNGTCVGFPVPNIEIKIIKITDHVISKLDSNDFLPIGEIGEIIVSGDVVTTQYYKMEKKTEESKIYDSNQNKTWHRIGDLGYFDNQGLLWFCGRKSHRVVTDTKKQLYSIPCEAIFKQHKQVSNAALIKIVNNQNTICPSIVIKLKDHSVSKKIVTEELLQLAQKYSITKDIQTIKYFNNFPVDIRHNIKIDRVLLSKIFQDQLNNHHLKRNDL